MAQLPPFPPFVTIFVLLLESTISHIWHAHLLVRARQLLQGVLGALGMMPLVFLDANDDVTLWTTLLGQRSNSMGNEEEPLESMDMPRASCSCARCAASTSSTCLCSADRGVGSRFEGGDPRSQLAQQNMIISQTLKSETKKVALQRPHTSEASRIMMLIASAQQGLTLETPPLWTRKRRCGEGGTSEGGQAGSW